MSKVRWIPRVARPCKVETRRSYCDLPAPEFGRLPHSADTIGDRGGCCQGFPLVMVLYVIC